MRSWCSVGLDGEGNYYGPGVSRIWIEIQCLGLRWDGGKQRYILAICLSGKVVNWQIHLWGYTHLTFHARMLFLQIYIGRECAPIGLGRRRGDAAISVGANWKKNCLGSLHLQLAKAACLFSRHAGTAPFLFRAMPNRACLSLLSKIWRGLQKNLEETMGYLWSGMENKHNLHPE